MSGGSFNYFCWNGRPDGLEEIPRDMAQSIRDYARTLDAETRARAEEAAVALEAFSDRARALTAHFDRLEPLFRAVEWWQSADYSFDRVLAYFDKINGDAGEGG